MLISGTASLRLRATAKRFPTRRLKTAWSFSRAAICHARSLSNQREHTDVCIRIRPSRAWQNFLTNHKIINSIIDLVNKPPAPSLRSTRKRCPHSPDGPLGEAITAVSGRKTSCQNHKPPRRRSKWSMMISLIFRLPAAPASLWETSLSPHHCHSSKVAACASMD